MLFNTYRFRTALISCALALLVFGCSSSDEDDETVEVFPNEPVNEALPDPTEFAVTQSFLPPEGKKKPISYSVFLLENLAFYRKGLDYENPGQFNMHYDGSWEFYADRIANYRKTSTSGVCRRCYQD